MITKYGRDSLVVTPVEAWERRDRRVGRVAELPDEGLEALRSARVPEELAYLDADLE